MIKVVIVEDDPNIAELHHHFIEQVEQYQVVGIAGSIHIAQQLVTHTKPDLVIVDNYLPDGQGVELVYQWLESDQKPECILVTAANDASTVQKAHRFGAFDYLVKPVDYSRLTESLLRFAKVKNHMHSQESFRQSQLDDLFHLGKGTPTDLAGLDPFMFRQVVDLFTHVHVEHTALSVSESLTISKSTARRYLDKAVEQGELVAFLEHGKVGRPTRVYRNKLVSES
ncbi:response regulator [Vibrio parahaemolyticus]|uniref:response regulator n=1 Tax=Vibrio parahaemolyticus TaxID=670 RepID=UPI001DA06FBF|nr:response regulator [Vibrio parahaemolyticus]BDP37644.1 transcriptional regulatory protein [Vibrio alginolyticus]EIO5095876.1 response regulator [Vibrio parahaemolyticus]MBE3868497.1 response regulator [Vibrio parahaemolyticus]MDF4488608.1 response regulator [Vibrio parahaemolyticus]MDG3383125.1 response regulator [Vibrio parahaemolyticus]